MKTPQSPAPVAGDEAARPGSEQPVEAIGARREEMAWHRERGLIYSLMQKGWRKGQPVMVNDVMIRVETCNGSETDIEPILQTILAALSPAAPARPELTVWYGKMPESNGRENWTALLRRVNPTDKWDQGFCFARSEYPGRVLYEADRVRWIIGERAERPDILAYDADAHSGYVEPASPARTPMGGRVDGHGGVTWPAASADLASEEGLESIDALVDMARVGVNLMERLPEGYAYSDCPSEIVTDLQNQLDEAKTPMGEGAKPAAWMYSHDGMNHDDECPETITRKRWPSCKEPWTEEALYTHPAPTPMGGEVEALREALMAAQSFIADGGLAESEPGASIYRQITQALSAPAADDGRRPR